MAPMRPTRRVSAASLGDFLHYSRIALAEAIKRVRTPQDARIALMRVFKALKTGGLTALLSDLRRLDAPGSDYASWIASYDTISQGDSERIKSFIAGLPARPLIDRKSVV